MENASPATAETGSATQPVSVNKEEKQFALIVYILQAVSILVGITGLVGIVMNYVKRASLTDEIVKAHNSWQIRTFWWTLGWSILCLILTTVTMGIGGISFLILLVWYIYRVVKGILRLNDAKAI